MSIPWSMSGREAHPIRRLFPEIEEPRDAKVDLTTFLCRRRLVSTFHSMEENDVFFLLCSDRSKYHSLYQGYTSVGNAR